MAKILGYRKAFRKSDNQPFFVFDLMGTPTAVVSSTGKISVTVPRTSIPTNTTSEEFVKAAVGMDLPGSIERIQVAPFEFKGRNGETLTGTHRWVFVAPNQSAQQAAVVSAEVAAAAVEDMPIS